MNVGSWLLWGFIATISLTLVTVSGQQLRFTRVNLPYLLGTLVTADRSRARLYGTLLHLLNGWVFSIVYVLVFEALGRATWWVGALGGLIQALFVLAVAMPVMPGVHPRMASEHAGPVARRQLEPPGMFALHYGVPTPAVLILSHLIYGSILGAFYHLR
ncbi:MAG: hypothetical protein ACJ790_11340 [Myxococcaceae bacterium]